MHHVHNSFFGSRLTCMVYIVLVLKQCTHKCIRVIGFSGEYYAMCAHFMDYLYQASCREDEKNIDFFTPCLGMFPATLCVCCE